MKKEDVLKRLAELEQLKNDPQKLIAAVSDLSKEVAETKGRSNGDAIEDNAILETLIKIGVGIYVVTDKGTAFKFPFQPNYRIYYKGSGKKRTKKEEEVKPEEKKPEPETKKEEHKKK